MTDSQKTWWAPLWCGLVADPEGTHVRRLGIAGWMLLYVILHARRQSGVLVSRRSVIARRMGIPLRTVQRWLRHLERHRYVYITERNSVATIRVLRWKPLRGRVSLGARYASSDA
jgi:hypothetical protein